MIYKIFSKIVLIICIVTTSHAYAAPDLFVGNVYDFLFAKNSSFSKSIMNNGDTTAFVKISVREVTFDLDGKVNEGGDIDVDELDNRLVVSPNRLIIPANGSRSSRIMFSGDREIERYFRITYVPVLPSKEDGFEYYDDKYANTLSVGFNMLIGYGTLVYVAPENTKYDTVFQEEQEKFNIINKGNASIKLNFLVSCQKDNKCTEPSTAILRPGKSISYDKNMTKSIRFTLVEGANELNKQFKL